MQSSSEHTIDTPRLRQILAELLRSDSDLDAFCLDHFREVHRRFSSSMDRTQKENILIIHAPSPDAIVETLRKRFPCASVWRAVSVESGTFGAALSVGSTNRPWLRITAMLISGVAGTAVFVFLVWRTLLHLTPAGQRANDDTGPLTAPVCNALTIDDLFLIKSSRQKSSEQLAIDVRLRHTGTSSGIINITRGIVQIIDKKLSVESFSEQNWHAKSPMLIHANSDSKLITNESMRLMADVKRRSYFLKLLSTGNSFGETAFLLLSTPHIEHDRPPQSVLMLPLDALTENLEAMGHSSLLLSGVMQYSESQQYGLMTPDEVLKIDLPGRNLVTLLACSSSVSPLVTNVSNVLNYADVLLKNLSYVSWMPSGPSNTYLIHISGGRNEAILAQRIAPGDVDRILFRVEFNADSAAFHYTAKLQIIYNGGCQAEFAPFDLSTDSAHAVLDSELWGIPQGDHLSPSAH